jgi:probable rRNA maturation factor
MVEIINRQQKIKVETEVFQLFAEYAINQISVHKSITIAFVSDSKIKELNQDFRGKNSTTDVLSFPYEAAEFEAEDDFLGDIIISLEQAKRQARENNLTFELEVKQLILHGILHLLGYDHETDEGQMNALELQLREKFEI